MSNTPDAGDVARLFHETYERLAPQFGYETREDTKAFDPESKNGRLMVATVSEILPALRAPRPAPEPAGEVVAKVRRFVERGKLVQMWKDCGCDGFSVGHEPGCTPKFAGEEFRANERDLKEIGALLPAILAALTPEAQARPAEDAGEIDKFLRTLRSHSGLNALQIWAMRDQAATTIATLTARIAELEAREKALREALDAEDDYWAASRALAAALPRLREGAQNVFEAATARRSKARATLQGADHADK